MVVQLLAPAARAAATAAARTAASTATKQAAAGAARTAASTATRSATTGVANTASSAGRGAAADARSMQGIKAPGTNPSAKPQPKPASQFKDSQEVSERFRQDRLEAERDRRLRDARSKAKRQSNGETSEEDEAPPYKSKMGIATMAMMLAIAVSVDLFQLLSAAIGTATFFGVAVSFVFNYVILAGALTLLFLWYTILGIEFLGKQQMILKGMTFLGELFSMGALPGLAVMIVVTYIMERDREKGGDGSMLGSLNRVAGKFGISTGAVGVAQKIVEKRSKTKNEQAR